VQTKGQTIWGVYKLAFSLGELRRFPEALVHVEEASSNLERLEPSNPDTFVSLHLYAELLSANIGDPANSIKEDGVHARNYELRKAAMGEGHKDTLIGIAVAAGLTSTRNAPPFLRVSDEGVV
jgi:hypothetical protein